MGYTVQKAPNKPTKHCYKQKDSGPCTQCVLRRHLLMAVTWVTPHPCPFTRPGPRGRAGGREAPPSGQGTLRGADRCRLASASSALPTGPPDNSGAGLGPRPLPQLGVGGGALPGRRLPGPQLFLPQLAWALQGVPGVVSHRRPPFCTFPFPGSAGAGTRQQGCSVFALGGCYLRSTPAAPISTVEGGLVSQQGPGHHRHFGVFGFFAGVGKERLWKSCWPSQTSLQPTPPSAFWAPKVRSPTLRGLTRGRSPGDMLTLSWD